MRFHDRLTPFALALLGVILSALPGLSQSPWLPEREQQALRSLMPEGVPVSPRLRFYRLPQVYQALDVLGDGVNFRERWRLKAVEKHVDPWVTSGGMHFVARDQWRNVTALDLPEGSKIELEHVRVDAGAPIPVTRVEWRFPIGTVAYDVLLRRGKPDRIFEIRTQERTKSGWADGTTYRPVVAIPDVRPQHWTWEFSPRVFDRGRETKLSIRAKADVHFVAPILGPVAFAARREVLNDGGHLIPLDYAGTGTSCTSCHSSSTVGARTGYGEAIRGSDGRFSWHPFTEDAKIDYRWPVKWAGQ